MPWQINGVKKMPIKRLEKTRKAYEPADLQRSRDFDWNGYRWCGHHKMQLRDGRCALCEFDLTINPKPKTIENSEKTGEKDGTRKPKT